MRPISADQPATTPSRARKWTAWLVPAAGLLVLHLVASLRFNWEPHGLAEWLKVSPDLVLLLGLACGAAYVRGYRWYLPHLLSCGLLLSVVWHFGSTVMRTFWHKEFEPYHDILMLPGLLHALSQGSWLPAGLDVQAPWVTFGVNAVVVLVAYSLLHLAARAVVRAAARPRVGVGLLAALQVLIVAGWIEGSARRPARNSNLFHFGMFSEARRSTTAFVRTRGWRTRELFEQRAALARSEMAAAPKDLGGLHGADVCVLFVESYGRLIARGRLAPEYERRLRGHERRLAEAGFACCSGFMRPAIRGGQSLLAHAELLTGLPVENLRLLDLLLQSDLVALPRLFKALGYATVDAQPGLPRPWPEDAFFGFEKNLFEMSFRYRGHVYHWGKMPDQYALAHVLEKVVKPSEKPVFLQFVSVTSHSPFSTVPPYVEDWDRVLAPGTFAGQPARTFPLGWADFGDHPVVGEAYLETIDYALRSMFAFAERLPRAALVIVLGDHQPPIAGELSSRDPSYDVPVHVLARDATLLGPFSELGFVKGLVGRESQNATPTSELATWFLRAYAAR
jgi:hypothetical protein